MMKPVHRAYSAAVITSLTAFTASVYLLGVPARFLVFLLRSLTLILLVLALTFVAVDRTTQEW